MFCFCHVGNPLHFYIYLVMPATFVHFIFGLTSKNLLYYTHWPLLAHNLDIRYFRLERHGVVFVIYFLSASPFRAQNFLHRPLNADLLLYCLLGEILSRGIYPNFENINLKKEKRKNTIIVNNQTFPHRFTEREISELKQRKL